MMMDGSLMDMVLTTVGVILTMAMLSCLCCLCMKFSDLKLKSYVVELAKKKGMKVDLDQIEQRPKPRRFNESCIFIMPDAVFIVSWLV